MSTYRLTRAENGGRIVAHHNRVTAEVDQDLQIFQEYLEESADDKYRSVPFLDRLEIFSNAQNIYADASGAAKNGLECVCGNTWAQGLW